MQPNASRDTTSPVDPRFTYCICAISKSGPNTFRRPRRTQILSSVRDERLDTVVLNLAGVFPVHVQR